MYPIVLGEEIPPHELGLVNGPRVAQAWTAVLPTLGGHPPCAAREEGQDTVLPAVMSASSRKVWAEGSHRKSAMPQLTSLARYSQVVIRFEPGPPHPSRS